ncbi:MLP-like protein 31 [Morus notabilis]|uniref:MLP-like protein 31 n=1 Tax=Morus notabilis TaxID=981085 RepID=W9RJ76_9ROSA|nr:kirola [Morus notabilis]XP_010108502.1 kirola [Morus notabilis]EXB80472.1 MLP-like protein 31 [Morus notabilis]EXC19581.1 MLP-like protein 31 [Morus notabilis]
MAQIAKMEVQLDIKSSAQSFYEIFRRKQYLMPKICLDILKDVQVIKGDWESLGSIKQWTYVAGNSESGKEIVEAIDEENKKITFKVLDGEITKYYKTMKTTVQVTAKGDKGGSSVKWTLEYEKLNDSIPAPTKYLDLLSATTKNVEAYLTNNA